MTAVQVEFERFKQNLIDQGLEKGLEKGQARAVLQVLELRGLMVPEPIRSRILSCTDLPTLQHWLARALQVATPEDIFAG